MFVREREGTMNFGQDSPMESPGNPVWWTSQPNNASQIIQGICVKTQHIYRTAASSDHGSLKP